MTRRVTAAAKEIIVEAAKTVSLKLPGISALKKKSHHQRHFSGEKNCFILTVSGKDSSKDCGVHWRVTAWF